MINIIITKNKLLLVTNDIVPSLPQQHNLLSIEHLLRPIIHNNEVFVATIEEDIIAEFTHIRLITLRQALNIFEVTTIRQIVYYQQLNEYYTTHKFCNTCGKDTVRQEQTKFIKCNSCNKEIYPHIAPCVIVRIHRANEILMARGVGFPPNVWGLIAGFVEIGESLEEAVIREVQEEVNIQIDHIKYWGSQAWPFPTASLMVGYTAVYKSGDIIVDNSEIEAANFYPRDNLPGHPSVIYSIASKMITEFINSPDKY